MALYSFGYQTPPSRFDEEELQQQPYEPPPVEPPAPEGFTQDVAEEESVVPPPEPPPPEGFTEDVVEEPPPPEGFTEDVTEPKTFEEKALAAREAIGSGLKAVPGLVEKAAAVTPLPVAAVLKAPELVNKGWNALRRSWLSGDIAMEMQKANPSVDYIAQQQKLADSIEPISENAKIVMNDNASGWDSIKALAADPLGVVTEMLGESFGTQARTSKDYAHIIPERVTELSVGGAIVGSPGGLPGAAAGATTGAEAGLTLGMAEMSYKASYAAEYSSSIIQSLQEAGVNPKDPEQLRNAFTNPEMMAKIRDKAEKKAVPVALLDGLSAAVGGRLFTNPAKTVGKKFLKWGGELAVQAGFGMGGEAGGQALSEGKITSWRNIMAEGLLEPAGSVHEILTGQAFHPEVTAPVPGGPVTLGPTAPGAPAVPPAIPSVPPVVPPGAAPGAVPPAGVPPVVPPTVTPPAAVPPGAVVPPVTPPVVAPPVTPPPISPGTAAEVVDQKVQSDNAKVSQMADQQAEKLQAANAPATAEAIKQVADQSNTEASVTAEEFMSAAQAKREAEGVTGAATPAEAIPPTAAAPISPGRVAATPRTTQEHAVVVGGQLYTGQTASEAMDAAMDHVGPDAMNTATTGWVDVDNKFISHETHDASQELAAAIGGGAVDPGHVKNLQAQVQQLMNRDTELNNQIIRPGGEQVIVPGINGQEAVVTARPSQELSRPLAGVKADMDVVLPDGTPGTVNLPASEALNEARNDRTTYSILLDCLK
jgi:hypothetical protein